MPDGSEQQAPPAWEYREHALIVLPGIEREEWAGLWSSVDRMGRSVSFWIGDALLAGQREFGEEFAQFVDAKYINQHRGPMWVCSRIEPARRRPSLSYTLHRELAARDRETQDGWLDQAEAGGWGVKELKEAMAAAERSNGGPPLDEAEPAENAEGFDEPDEPDLQAENAGDFDAESEPDDPDEPSSVPEEQPDRAAGRPVVADLRRCIEEIRAVAKKLALKLPDPEIHSLPNRIAAALAIGELNPNPLTDALAAIDCIPDEWRASIRIEGGEKVFGGQRWTVELQKPGGGLALGIGPWLPASILEAALAATISDQMSP